jgi:hypothetical protein
VVRTFNDLTEAKLQAGCEWALSLPTPAVAPLDHLAWSDLAAKTVSAIRNGRRPPFREDPAERAARTESNAFLKTLQSENVVVVDIEPLFAAGDGGIRFADDEGALLYYDGTHLSDAGADLVKADVIRAIAN